jgi:hypothetical protein
MSMSELDSNHTPFHRGDDYKEFGKKNVHWTGKFTLKVPK